jgi:hypothetical protein
MRDEAFLRAEIRWLIERARVALDLPPSAVAGCTDEQITEVLEAQQISGLSPPLDELLRVAGVADHGTVLGELFRATGVGWKTMLRAKDNARMTARISETGEEFGPDRAVFLADPGGTVFWLEPEGLDPPVWSLTEAPRIGSVLVFARLCCWLELELVRAELGWPSHEYWPR